MDLNFRQKFRCFPQSMHPLSSALKLRGETSAVRCSSLLAGRDAALPQRSTGRAWRSTSLLTEVGSTAPYAPGGTVSDRDGSADHPIRQKDSPTSLPFFLGHAMRMRDLSSRCLVPPMLLGSSPMFPVALPAQLPTPAPASPHTTYTAALSPLASAAAPARGLCTPVPAICTALGKPPPAPPPNQPPFSLRV